MFQSMTCLTELGSSHFLPCPSLLTVVRVTFKVLITYSFLFSSASCRPRSQSHILSGCQRCRGTALAGAVLTQVMEKGPQCRAGPTTSAQYRSHFFCGEKQNMLGCSPAAHPRCLLSHFARQSSCWEEAQLLQLASSSLPGPPLLVWLSKS